MITLLLAWYAYLCICLVIFTGCVADGLYEDLTHRKYIYRKFGPNYKSSVFWIFTSLASIPVVNLITLGFLIYIRVKRGKAT